MLHTHIRHIPPFPVVSVHSHQLLRCVSSAAASESTSESLSSSQSSPVTTVTASSQSSDSTRITASWPSSSDFASYKVALPPTPAQLKYADRFFETSPPKFLRSHAKFRTLPLSSVPEVAFLGRSNVGKSSLLNALLHRTGVKIASISSKPGHTRLMNAFSVGDVQVVGGSQKNPSRFAKRNNTITNSTPPSEHVDHERWEGRGGLVVLDMPGYGHASRKEWGGEIVKYLTARKQLRRTFILVDCQHGLKSSDLHMIDLLTQNGISYQLVLSKIDKILVPSGKPTINGLINQMPRLSEVADTTRKSIIPEDTRRRLPLTDLIMCSSQISVPPGSGKKIGIDNLRWAVLTAVGQDADAQGQKTSIAVDLVSQQQAVP